MIILFIYNYCSCCKVYYINFTNIEQLSHVVIFLFKSSHQTTYVKVVTINTLINK